MKSILQLIIFSFTITQAIAQLNLSGEIRPRFEYRHGYQNLFDSSMSAATFVSQRTRLSVQYETEGVKAGLTLQDVRTWGNQPLQTTADGGQLTVFESWIEFPLVANLKTKIGRQVVSYDDQRLFGSGDWNQTGRTHDCAILKYEVGALRIHAGAALNRDKEMISNTAYTVQKNYRSLQFLYANYKAKNSSVSALFINHGLQSPASAQASRYSQTAGINYLFEKNKVRLAGKYYYQFGIDQSKKNIDAYMTGFEFAFLPVKPWELIAGIDLISGQSQTDTSASYNETIHNFSTLYGTGHRFAGFMDYFYAGSSHGNVGLINGFLKTKYKREEWFTGFDVHYFQSAAGVRRPGSSDMLSMDTYLGAEIDWTIGYSINKFTSLLAGYSQLFATESLEVLKGGDHTDTQNWFFIMITCKPVFYSK